MKRDIKFKLVIFTFISLIGVNVFSQMKIQKDFDTFFFALAKNQDFNGNVLVAEKGKIVYEKSFGYADFPGKRLNTKDTLFPIASISKTITATAILQQVEKEKIRLDDPVVKILPDFPYPGITIRHLLSHTSGMPSYNAFFDLNKSEAVYTNSDFISGLNLKKKPPIYPPGENWNYDNTNFVVLVLILEKVSGEKYPDYVKKHILQPAGMSRTFFFQSLFDASKNKIEGLVIPHLYPQIYADEPVSADSISFIADYWKTFQFSGFGDYVSTTHDLLKYDQALYNGTLLGDKVLREAFSPVKLNNGKPNAGNYGLGWTIALDETFGKIVFHTGSAIGLNCVLYRNIDKNQTVIAFDIAHQSANYLAGNALKILNNQQVSLPKKKLIRIYGKILTTRGKAAGAKTIKKLVKDTAHYELDKEDLITLGYEFMGDLNPYHLKFTPRYDEALEVFKLCIDLFPDYWNSYDSYGDALARTGNKKLAIAMYQKSLELKPDSEGGKKALQKLLEETND